MSVKLDEESCSFVKSDMSKPLIGLVVDNDEDPVELNFDQVPETDEEKEKIVQIENALKMLSETEDRSSMLKTWQNFAISKHGLVNDKIRRIVWPLLLDIDPNYTDETPSLHEFKNHSEFHQVVLDVNRSLKRFPPGIPYEKRIALQDKLTALIMRIITKYPYLHYYQGYHDVAITFLLVVGDALAFAIMEKLSTNHFLECMGNSLDLTVKRLQSILPLLYHENYNLGMFIEHAEIGVLYALPWYLTWFGHSLNQYRDVVRLYDYFLAKSIHSSLYVCAALVLARTDEVLDTECDMPAVHSLLSAIPDHLDFDDVLSHASSMYDKYPPDVLEHEISCGTFRYRNNRRRGHTFKHQLSKIKERYQYWLPVTQNRNNRYAILLATASIAFGMYAFLKRSDMFFL